MNKYRFRGINGYNRPVINLSSNSIIKGLQYSAIAFSLVLLGGCGLSVPDTVEDTGKQPPLELPPIEINVASHPTTILKEEIFGRWKITELDEWKDGDYVWFMGDDVWFMGDNHETMFRFNCNVMNVKDGIYDEGIWDTSQGRYGTTEAFCAGDRGGQDKALLSLMIGPSKVERIGTGSNAILFSNNNHEMTLERFWSDDTKINLSQEDLMGDWDIIRFDDFTLKSRLNGEGKRAGYVDFHADKFSSASLRTSLHIGCNFSGNVLRLDINDSHHKLPSIPEEFGRVTTDKGCSPDLQKRDEDFFAMINQSPKVERLGEERLRLWTEKHELILERATIGQARNTIRKFDTIVGKWSIIKVEKGGLGLGGSYYVPEPIIISKEKIQYGERRPYLKAPKIQRGKIVGDLVGDFGDLDCSLSRAFSLEAMSLESAPIATEPNALCFVLDTLIGQPIAEPTSLPDYIHLTSGEYSIVLTHF